MTWRPVVNILRPEALGGGAFASAQNALVWPSSSLRGGGDYSVDFDRLLSPGEFITSFRFEAGGADLAWTSLFGNIVTAWMRWKASGTQSVTVCALTSEGNSRQVEVSITVSPREALFPLDLPDSPDAPTQSGGKLSSEAMDNWLRALPTAPPESGSGWYNNAGIPTRLGDLT